MSPETLPGYIETQEYIVPDFVVDKVGILAVDSSEVEYSKPPKVLPVFRGESFVVFEGNTKPERSKSRDVAIRDMLSTYSNNDNVQSALTQLQIKTLKNQESQDEMGAYLQHAGNYELLTREDEKEIFTRIEVGMEAYQYAKKYNLDPIVFEDIFIDATIAHRHVYLANLRWVVANAKKYPANGMTTMDLIQEGNIGLMTSINRFDHTSGFKFSTYATWWIRQNITRSIADKTRLIRLPVHVHDMALKLKKTVTEFEKFEHRTPDNHELSALTDIPVEKIDEYLVYSKTDLISLDKTVEGTDDLSVGENVEDESAPDDEDIVNQLMITNEINRLFSNEDIPPRQRIALSLYQGCYVPALSGLSIETSEGTKNYDDLVKQMNDKGLPLRKIGRLLGLSGERIRTDILLAQRKMLAKADTSILD